MKTKKFFSSVIMFTVMAGGPLTVSSCGTDDVIDAVLEIVDILLTPNDLSGTAWISTDNSMAFEFTNSSNGVLYSEDSVDENGNAIAQSFTYSIDTSNNILTIRLNSRNIRFEIEEFEPKQSLVLKYNGYTMYFVPYTE